MKATDINKKASGNPEKALPSGFLQCRQGMSGHAWDITGSLDMPQPRVQKGKPVYRRCVRCGSFRMDQINAIGDVVYRRYVYPTGYRLPEKVGSFALRVELLRRIRLHDSEFDLITSFVRNENA